MTVVPGRACIHVGHPKAASTTLQRGLFDRHSGAFFLGQGCSGAGTYTSAEARAISFGLPEDLSEAELRVHARAFEEETGEARAEGRVPVLSREGLFGGGAIRQPRMAANARAIFGPYRLFLVVRNPLTMFPSLYLQRLKGNNVRWSERPWEEPRGYFTPDEWLEWEWGRPGRGHLQLLQVHDALAPHLAQEGRENVAVFLFEELRDDPARFIRAVCGFVGIDGEEGVRLAASFHGNPRITEAHVRRLRTLHRTPARRELVSRSEVRSMRRLMGLHRGHHFWKAPPAKASLPDLWRERIREACGDQYRRLADTWGLDLERWGYPV